MSGQIKLKLPSGGSKTIAAPDSAATETITLPAGTKTLATVENFTSTGIDDNATSTKLTTTSTGIDVTGTVIADGLTVDTNTLYVDSPNNRVGIGTSSPSSNLDVVYQGNTSISGPTTGTWTARVVNQHDSPGYNGLSVQNRWASTNSYIFEAAQGWNGATNGYFPVFTIDGHGQAIFKPQGSEAMRIDSSGNLKFDSGYGSAATAYGCRAWVNFNGTGTVAIRASGNVSSITDNGTGDYTVNFTTAMPDANYSAVAARDRFYQSAILVRSYNTGSVGIAVVWPNVAFYDAYDVSLAVFR